jgi:hypothetical protein
MVTRAVRSRAIYILQCMIGSVSCGITVLPAFFDHAHQVGEERTELEEAAWELAYEAYIEAKPSDPNDFVFGSHYMECLLEAEGMLRNGWSPGEVFVAA